MALRRWTLEALPVTVHNTLAFKCCLCWTVDTGKNSRQRKRKPIIPWIFIVRKSCWTLETLRLECFESILIWFFFFFVGRNDWLKTNIFEEEFGTRIEIAAAAFPQVMYTDFLVRGTLFYFILFFISHRRRRCSCFFSISLPCWKSFAFGRAIYSWSRTGVWR